MATATTAMHCLFIAICTISLLLMASFLLDRNQSMSPSSRSFRYPATAGQHEESKSDTSITTELAEATSLLTPSTALELEHIMGQEQDRRKRTLAEECRRINPSEPTGNYRYLHVNDKHKLLFHFIPKVSSTTWKTILSTLNNETGNVKPVLFNYKQDDARLKSYRKVLFIREPMSRLLSAYLSKLRNRSRLQRIWERSYGSDISRRYRGVKNQTLKEGQWFDITFVEFSKYITDLGSGFISNDITDHWLPQYKLSRPCHVKYDFIGHFENLAVEGPFVLRWLGVDNIVHFPEYHSSNAKQQFLKYYKSISPDLMRKLIDYYHVDYRLFGYSPDDAMSQVLQGV
ncbi:carbohydrate sulfotransferase 14-like [Asterias amurensis]|uniref:carbohydrate sulfotransferase 14-like n=1 Tax=Asterias amurensis TaxID=7602 RepID=UPI003AB46767